MKVVKVVILNDEGQEEIMEVLDGAMLLVCAGNEGEENKVLTQTTKSANINLALIKTLLKD